MALDRSPSQTAQVHGGKEDKGNVTSIEKGSLLTEAWSQQSSHLGAQMTPEQMSRLMDELEIAPTDEQEILVIGPGCNLDPSSGEVTGELPSLLGIVGPKTGVTAVEASSDNSLLVAEMLQLFSDSQEEHRNKVKEFLEGRFISGLYQSSPDIPDEAYDLVTAFGLENDSGEDAIQSLISKLRPGGWAIITSDQGRMRQLIRSLFEDHSGQHIPELADIKVVHVELGEDDGEVGKHPVLCIQKNILLK